MGVVEGTGVVDGTGAEEGTGVAEGAGVDVGAGVAEGEGVSDTGIVVFPALICSTEFPLFNECEKVMVLG